MKKYHHYFLLLPPPPPPPKFSASLNRIFVQIFFIQLALFVHNFHYYCFQKVHHYHSRIFACFAAAPAILHDIYFFAYYYYLWYLFLIIGVQVQHEVNLLLLCVRDSFFLLVVVVNRKFIEFRFAEALLGGACAITTCHFCSHFFPKKWWWYY